MQTGLSESAARTRFESEGPNELPVAKSQHISLLLKEVLLEPMVTLILGCGIVYVFLGEREEAAMLLGFLFIILFITIYQKWKSESALEALKNLSSPRAMVIRDGKRKRIPGREVVRGDVLLLNEGDRVPADCSILTSSVLIADESLLTGESMPVTKNKGENLFAGTMIIRGQATVVVEAIGPFTQIGKIGKILNSESAGATSLQLETKKLIKVLAIVAMLLCLLVVIVYSLSRGDWLGGFLAALTLAMAILPNEFPAVLLIFLALGAWRISQRQVLTRKMSAIENLGATTVLCVDKTGTLTLNQMSVKVLCTFNEKIAELDLTSTGLHELPEEFHELIEYGILASSPSPYDPMEKAIHQVGGEYLIKTEHLHPEWLLTREYPLTPEMFSVSQVWRKADSDIFFVGAKGAPEAIIDLCHLNTERSDQVKKQVEKLAQYGLRVLGVARALTSPANLPSIQHGFDFEFLGLIGLADPVRAGVTESIRDCYNAGIRVIMITGDHAQTARNIAKEIKLQNPDEVITGYDLSTMDEALISKKIKTVNCFARVMPEQKLRIVKELQKNGEVVAMTGDGVNDAPALRVAQVGIAMGKRGTDVARESASIVLLNDDFSSIVEAIRTGRRIYDNLRSAMAYLLAIHIPIAGMSIFPILLGLPLVFLPVHIAFLHLIIEPACSVVFEAEPASVNSMNKPPRPMDKALFSKDLIIPSLIQGTVVFAIIMLVFLVAIMRGHSESDARALTFTTLIFANLGLLLINRSWSATIIEKIFSPNRALWLIIIGSLLFLFVVLYQPSARSLFSFSFLHPIDLAISLLAALVSTIWFEIWKIVKRPRSH